MNRITDHILVRKAKNGDKTAFGTLFERHGRKVFNLLVRLCGEVGLAEDLTQETFLTAYTGLGSWRGVGRFSTWLCGIAARQYLASRRKTHATEPLDTLEAELVANPTSDPLARYTEKEALAALDTAILALPDTCREVFVLVRVQELRYREVAALLEIPLGTVQSRLNRATVLLQQALTPCPDPDSCPTKGTQSHAL